MTGALYQFAQTADTGQTVAGILALILGIVLILALMAAFVFIFVLWIMSIVHALQHEDVPDRVVWIIMLFVIGSILGPVYWLAIKRPYDARHH